MVMQKKRATRMNGPFPLYDAVADRGVPKIVFIACPARYLAPLLADLGIFLTWSRVARQSDA